MKLSLLLAAIAALAACTSATRTSAADQCAAMPDDTLYTRFRPAYRECGYTLLEVPPDSVENRAAFIVGHALQ